MSSGAYHRKKQPELVRRTILEKARDLAVTDGIAAVSIQAVATASGVTKGGVLHHFPTKHDLITAVFAQAQGEFDAEIDRQIGGESETRGCFTRAYVEVLMASKEFGIGSPFDALALLTIADPVLAELWNDWLVQRLKRHAGTDDDPALELVRYAADGIWLSYLGRRRDAGIDAWRIRLLAMTRS